MSLSLSVFPQFIAIGIVFSFRTASHILNVVLVGTNYLQCQHCSREIFLIAILDLDDNGRKEGEPDDVEDEEESHEEVEDVVDGEHLNQLQRN